MDPRYSTSTTITTPNNFSPVAINLRATPTIVNAAVRAEVDSRYHQVRQVSANGTVNWRQQLLTTVGWSHSFYIAELAGYNNPDNLSTI